MNIILRVEGMMSRMRMNRKGMMGFDRMKK
jgi:hypothetical protein